MNFVKEEERINLDIPSDSNHHIRDHKLWFENGTWYMLLGNSTVEKGGRVLLYQSKSLKEWSFKFVLARSNGKMGYMFECPDFFRIVDKHVLIFFPQGMEAKYERYKNFNQSGYLIGDFNYENGVSNHNDF
ncbi:hypothetical protein KS664_003026 [Clostridium perfringens]|nr:hypothetical protein [Clostridium perfringens]